MNEHIMILGGGVAGMSAAHELAERGFKVTVFERKKNLPGGKARSVPVKDTATEGRGPLPGEHGFRFFPGFYKHVTDTMRRIPFQNPLTGQYNKQGVFDNLVECPKMMLSRVGQQPIIALSHLPRNLEELRLMLKDVHTDTGLTEAEKQLMESKIWQLMTSCQARRENEYEHIGWWEYTEAESNSKNYRTLFVQGLTRTLVAARAKDASTKTGGTIFLQLLFTMADPFVRTDRVLCGPTSEVWLYPWLQYLKSLGVDFQMDSEVMSLETDRKSKTISGVMVSQGGQESKKFTADYYICALPVERAAKLITKDILILDPCLSSIAKLAKSVAWMNGIQFYLTEKMDIINGHIILADSPWALTAISQVQFWKYFDISKYGDGTVKCIISVDVSDWDTKGVVPYRDEEGRLYHKSARHCNREEAIADIWLQMKQSFNKDNQVVLKDEFLKLVHVDGDIKFGESSVLSDEEPLLVNKTYTWDLRQETYTGILNLFLASDYIKTYTDLATMEGANEAARRAVNGIIDVTNSKVPSCRLWMLREPDILLYHKWLDNRRYNKGLPWKLHAPFFYKFFNFMFRLIKKLTTS
ncbi:MAG TPA: FAD-dependent oxidoreductase [Chitinophagaceae bacterium]|nr:FAD-dependent oxidoreductase [Chitinophagaceae bacterium]